MYDTTTRRPWTPATIRFPGWSRVRDDVTLNDPTTGTYATKDPGTGINVSVTGLDLQRIQGGGLHSRRDRPSGANRNHHPRNPHVHLESGNGRRRTRGVPGLHRHGDGICRKRNSVRCHDRHACLHDPATSHSPPGSFAMNGSGLSATDYKFVQAPSNSTAFTLTGSFVPEDEAADTASRIPSSFSSNTATFTKIHRFSVHYETRFDYGGKTDPLSEGSLGYASSYTTFAPGPLKMKSRTRPMTRSKVTWIGVRWPSRSQRPVRYLGRATISWHRSRFVRGRRRWQQPAAPAGPAASADNWAVLAEPLGITLIPSAERLNKGGAGQGGVAVDGLSWLNRGAVESLAHGFLSRPLTKGALAKLVQGLVLLSRQENHPVVEVYAPPQDISSGVVQIVVLVARVGQVKVEGNKWFSTEDLARQVRIKPSNDHGRQPCGGPGLAEAKPIPAGGPGVRPGPGARADRRDPAGGGRAAGAGLCRVRRHGQRGYRPGPGVHGLQPGRPLGGRQPAQLPVHPAERDWKLLQAHGPATRCRCPTGTRCPCSVPWARADSITGGLFDLQGINWQVGTRYNIPLPSLPGDTQTLSFGADYKWSNNNLRFGGTQIFTSPANIAQGVLVARGSSKDAQGTTSGSLTGYYSPTAGSAG